MAAPAWTTCTSTCVCAPSRPCGTRGSTVKTSTTPASGRLAPTAPAPWAPVSSPATARTVSRASTAPRMWTSARATLAQVLGPTAPTESTATPATAPWDSQGTTAWTTWALVQRRRARTAPPVPTSWTPGTSASVRRATRGPTAMRTSMNATPSRVKMGPSAKTVSTCTSVSACRASKATTATWTSTSVPPNPARTTARVSTRWTTTSVNVQQVLKVGFVLFYDLFSQNWVPFGSLHTGYLPVRLWVALSLFKTLLMTWTARLFFLKKEDNLELLWNNRASIWDMMTVNFPVPGL